MGDGYPKPQSSRQQLGNWFDLHEDPGKYSRLILYRYYGEALKDKLPRLLERSSRGLERTSKGNTKIVFKRLSSADRSKIYVFLSFYKKSVLLGRNQNLEQFEGNEVDCCLALDFNFKQVAPKKIYTEIGQLVHDAKFDGCRKSELKLVENMAGSIGRIPGLSTSSSFLITNVPSNKPERKYLGLRLARKCTQTLQQKGVEVDLLEATTTMGGKATKNRSLERKRRRWEILTTENEIELSENPLNKVICIIDDVYQSGTTLWYYARYLRSKGAARVFGLVCEKTWRDTANVK